MAEDLMLSKGKLTSESDFGNAKHQNLVHLWGTIVFGVYYMMLKIIVGEWIDKFK